MDFLPIGSICKIKNRAGLVMITGYFKFDYDKEIKKSDYVGCLYPEGMYLSNNIVSFNNVDIEKIVYDGYKNDDFEKLNKSLNIANGSKILDNIKQSSKLNIAFDENGVVVFDADRLDADIIDSDEKTENPFTAPDVVQTKDIKQKNPSSWPIFNHLEFDENGVVKKAVENDPNNPNDVDDVPTVLISKNNKENIAKEINNSSTPSGFKFDENGFVISDDSVKTDTEKAIPVDSKPTGSYKFDENGFVISDDNSKQEPVNIDAVQPSNGTKTSNTTPTEIKPSYKFDENGFVISE